MWPWPQAAYGAVYEQRQTPDLLGQYVQQGGQAQLPHGLQHGWLSAAKVDRGRVEWGEKNVPLSIKKSRNTVGSLF